MGRKAYSLPVLVKKDMKIKAGFAVGACGFLLYLLANHFHLTQPQILKPSAYDALTPFIPQTIWIYNSALFLFWTPYFICKHQKNQNRYLYAYGTLVLISVVCFVVFPTTLPRASFPIPDGTDYITNTVFALTRWVDSPANCTPSLHVSGSFLSVFLLLHEKRHHGKFPYFLLWAMLVSISTMTTKQHYLIDAVTGFSLAVAVHWFFATKISFYKPTSRPLTEPGAVEV